MALEKFEYPATGTVTESWSPTRNPSYAGAPRRKNYGVAAEESAGNQLYAYGSALWTYLLTRAYGNLADKEWAELENFADMVGGDKFKFTDNNGIPWKVSFGEFERPSRPARGDRWDTEFTLRAELKPHPSLKKIPSQFHRDLLFYAPLTGNLDAFSRWDPTATFTRSTTATYRGSDGLIKTTAINAARHEYDSALSALGVLIEGQRTNGWTQSERQDDAAWTKNAVSISLGATQAPAGTAVKVLESVTNTDHWVGRATPSLTDNTKQALSFFAKAAERSWIFVRTIDKANITRRSWINLANGTLGTVNAGHTVRVYAHALSWYRVEVIWDAASGATAPAVELGLATGDGIVTYAGDGSSGVFMWGAQFEVDQASASSYIPTTTAAVTRAADTLTFVSDGNALVNGGTLFCIPTISSWRETVSLVFVEIDDNSNNNRHALMTPATGVRKPLYKVVRSGAAEGDLAPADGVDDFVIDAKKSLAATWGLNDLKLYSSGVQRATDVSATMPSLTTIRIGGQAVGGEQAFARIRDIAIFARAFTAAEIATIHNAL